MQVCGVCEEGGAQRGAVAIEMAAPPPPFRAARRMRRRRPPNKAALRYRVA